MSVWVGERDLALLLPHLQRKHWQLSTGGSSFPLLLRPSPHLHWPPSSSHTFSLAFSLYLSLVAVVQHKPAQFLTLTIFPLRHFHISLCPSSLFLSSPYVFLFCCPLSCLLKLVFCSFFLFFFFVIPMIVCTHSLGILHQAKKAGETC